MKIMHNEYLWGHEVWFVPDPDNSKMAEWTFHKTRGFEHYSSFCERRLPSSEDIWIKMGMNTKCPTCDKQIPPGVEFALRLNIGKYNG